TEFATNDGGQR
nr:RecName: Full=Acharan sulfate lyase 2 [Bacteroides stercoris]